MKVYVWKDETYPIYAIDTDPLIGEKMIEIPDEVYERYEKAIREYYEVQGELSKYSCEEEEL